MLTYAEPMLAVAGRCASCWTFASTSALSDRLRIHTDGRINVLLSAQNLVDCVPGYHARSYHARSYHDLSYHDLSYHVGAKPCGLPSVRPYYRTLWTACQGTMPLVTMPLVTVVA